MFRSIGIFNMLLVTHIIFLGLIQVHILNTMTWINTASYFEDICILELERNHNGVTESIVFINGVFCSPPFFLVGCFLTVCVWVFIGLIYPLFTWKAIKQWLHYSTNKVKWILCRLSLDLYLGLYYFFDHQNMRILQIIIAQFH